MEKIIVVDDEDNLLGVKDRGSLTRLDIYRVSALWITNNKGQIFLAKRAYTKKNDPGMWGPAVAGTVEEGETYKLNMVKEAEEELGLKNLKLKEGPKQRVKSPHNHFTQWFFSELKDDVLLDFDKKEVAEVKWFDKEELITIVEKNPEKIVPSMIKFIKSIY